MAQQRWTSNTSLTLLGAALAALFVAVLMTAFAAPAAAQGAGTLTVVKTIDGVDDGTLFVFDVSLGATGWTGELGDGQSETFTGLDGSYTVFELLPVGWTSEPTCVDADGNTPPGFVDSGSDFAAAFVEVNSGDEVTCTFTNTPIAPANLTIITAATGASAGTSFGYETNQGPFDVPANGSLVVPVNPGELFVLQLPEPGWDLSAVVCSTPFFFDGEEFVEFVLTSGQDATCVFTNVEAPAASLTITKETVGGDPTGQTFVFDTGTSTVAVAAGESATTPVAPGELEIIETAPGWELGDVECTGSPSFFPISATSFIVDVPEDGVVDCIVTNFSVAPVLVNVTKTVTGVDDGTLFTFGAGATPGTLQTDQAANGGTVSFDVEPGDLFVTEVPIDGWTVTDAVCDGGLFIERLDDFTFFMEAPPGAVVNCTFTNELDAYAGTPDPPIVPSFNPLDATPLSEPGRSVQAPAAALALMGSVLVGLLWRRTRTGCSEGS